MNRRGDWSLSPAYDITFACDPGNRWLKAHQTTINGKISSIAKDDLIACGQKMDLKASKCKRIIEEVYSAVKEFQNIAQSVGMRDETIGLNQNELEKQFV